MNNDSRQLMIVMQNALAHATQITMHNNKDKQIKEEDVIKMAQKIAAAVFETVAKTSEVVEDSTVKSFKEMTKK